MSEAKPFCISKQEVWEAYKRVKANQGAAGVDEQSIADFERNLKRNLYKIWNRISSGSYFPPPVRTVKIPKANGGERQLGIPTVSDRIAQMVVKSRLEPGIDPLFHPDSYGYRPGKSALDAVGQARQRCWQFDWVIDLDIKGFFDNIDHELLMRAVRKHAKDPWAVLYIGRWLTAPAQDEEGRLTERGKGGSVHRVRAVVLAESECAGRAPVHPASVYSGGVSRLDRAVSVEDGREFSTQCGAPLDPANGGYSLLTPDGRGCMAELGWRFELHALLRAGAALSGYPLACPRMSRRRRKPRRTGLCVLHQMASRCLGSLIHYHPASTGASLVANRNELRLKPAAVGLGGSGCRTALQGCQHL